MVWIGVLAGGWGKRLGPLTESRPKPLLRIGGRRIIDYTLEQVLEARPSSGVVVVHPAIARLDGVPSPLRVVAQEGPGLKSAIRTALNYADDDIVVLSFTGYLSRPNTIVSSLLEYYTVSDYQLVMALAPVSSGLETFGFARLGFGGRVEKVTEKLEEWRAGRGYVFAGVLAGKKSLVETLAQEGFINGVNLLSAKGLVGGYIWEGDWLEIAYPWDLLEAPRLLIPRYETAIREGAEVAATARIGRGVIIERGAYIGENTVVIGPSYIGADASIGPNSVIGPGTIIEKDSRVGPLTLLENTIVMVGATVGASTIMSGGVVGEGGEVAPHVVGEKGRLDDPPEWAIPLLEGRRPRNLVMGPLIRPGSKATSPCMYLRPGELV
ncbi:MAG: NDP-sugar synthase [Desulfurococcales archaeon]|nr:NDP-sugar synthase [Desulfurococcales archaeon]